MTDQHCPTESPAKLLLREVWSRGDIALVEELVTDDYVEYDPVRSDSIRGPEAVTERVLQFRQAMPDLTRTIDRTLVDGAMVVLPYTATGTHEGTILGITSTGRKFEVDGVFLSRVVDGRLVEGTDLWDAFGLLRQLGAVPDSIAARRHY